MQKKIIKNGCILFSILLLAMMVGCAPKRVHKTIEVKENKEAHQPLARLQPLKSPKADEPSKTIAYYKQKKTRKIVRRSRSASPAKPPAPKPVMPAVPRVVPETKIEITTHYQARLNPGWEANGLKYLSIDGLRYSHDEIMTYSRRSGSSSPFSLQNNGVLLINLNRSFTLELAFYPPNTTGHEKFLEFDLQVFNKKGEVVHKEYVSKRLQVYTVEK